MGIQRKGVMLILDGLGDLPCPELAGATPLEAARTPVLDELLRGGQGGMADPLFPGIPVGTHTGTAMLLGLAPGDAGRLARGPTEAEGIGIQMRPGDLALRCNFATLAPGSDGLRILDRRAGRITEGAQALSALLRDLDLGDGIRGDLHPATQHRAVLSLRGDPLSPRIGDTDPGAYQQSRGLLQSVALEDSEAAVRTAGAVNRFSVLAHQRLAESEVNRQRIEQGLPPANGVICRGVGQAGRFVSLLAHYGVSAAVVSAESTVIGLGRIFGYTGIQRPEFTAMPDTNIDAKLAAAVEALDAADLVFVHLKGPDIAAHDRKPELKRDFIERLDRSLSVLLDRDLVLAVTGDHSTDSNRGRHTGDPVPSLLFSPGGRRDACSRFGETQCMNGGLGRIQATALLAAMLDAMGALHQFAPRDYPLLFG